MNSKNIKVKLSEKDRKIIIRNSNICTDSHGKSCEIPTANEHNKNLN